MFYILLASLSDLTTLVYPRSLEHHTPAKGSPPTVAPVDRTNRRPLNAAQVQLTVERLFACIPTFLDCYLPISQASPIPGLPIPQMGGMYPAMVDLAYADAQRITDRGDISLGRDRKSVV